MLSLTELSRAARVLGARIVGHRVQAIAQPDATRVVLTTYGAGSAQRRGRRQHLLLSCRPESARASLLAAPPAAPPRPPAFAQFLRARLLGARVTAARIVGADRQLAIRLETRAGDFDLLLAILGRRSNVVLLDAEGRIAAALRPLADTRPELETGAVWRAPASRPPTAGEDRFADLPDEEWLDAIEQHYAEAEDRDLTQGLRGRLEQALRKRARSLDRKLEKLDRELSQAREATACERRGQLLKSVLPSVRKGDAQALARDFETGEEVAIPLDPAKTPAQNLEALFGRYRKAVRTLTKAGAQQEAVRGQREALAALEGELRAALAEGSQEGAAALAALAARPELARLLARHAPARRTSTARPSRARETTLAGRQVPGRLVPRRFGSAAGLEIWVGRSDEGNDYLTTRLARGNDLFFHLDGAPGSHVVLRTQGRPDPPSEAVLDACELAVHYSKAKNASRADVHVVPIKNVRKPKGSKPGLVTVHGGRTVHLRRTPARLERVLASRIEEGPGLEP